MPASEQSVTPGIFRRLGGMAYEAMLLAAVLAVLLIMPHVLIGAFTRHIASTALLWVHLVLLLLIYFVWFWCNGGQTLAMKTWRIRLCTRAGMTVRPAQAVLRFVLCWPSIGVFGIGILWALVDRDRQFLHDRLAGTRLIKS